MPGPITPSEAKSAKVASIPDAVFEAFNELIAENLSNGSATVKQCDVVKLIVAKMGVSSSQIWGKRWLDVESAYEKAGWKVKYDKPAYNETFEAYFVFEEP